MRFGIGPDDSRRLILLKLCYLVPLTPFNILYGCFMVGVPEVVATVRRETREVYRRLTKPDKK